MSETAPIIDQQGQSAAPLYCSFCGKRDKTEANIIVCGPTVYICAECVEVCVGVVISQGGKIDVDQWRPIETAPADEQILLWHPGSKYQERGAVIGHMTAMSFLGMIPVFGCTTYSQGDATHWMPLPNPPLTP
jgi:hypothetical protein